MRNPIATSLSLAALSLAGTLPALAQVNWVTVRDTREQAFSIDVPQGWTIRGGMFRAMGALNPRPVVDMTSPDGKTNIRIGDRGIPRYALSNPVLDRLGFTEGKIMPQLNTWPIVARYRKADEYIAKYGPLHFGPMCQSLQTRAINTVEPRIHKQSTPGGQVSAAEGLFVCTLNGDQMLGYVYSETWATAVVAGGFWDATTIGTFLAPMAQAQQAGDILKHSWGTFAFNPVWGQEFADLVKGTASQSTKERIIHQQESQAQGEYARSVQAQQADTFSDILTGTTVTRDPATGQIRRIATGAGGQHWTNNAGTVIESALSPGPGYRQLETVNH